ncbi:unnamed protein product [Umbelopsis ramanniana]
MYQNYDEHRLETIVIAFLLLQYSSRCDNKRPYPRFVYRHIPSGMLVGDGLAQSRLIATNTFGLLQRALIVGSSSLHGLYDQIQYRELMLLVAGGQRCSAELLPIFAELPLLMLTKRTQTSEDFAGTYTRFKASHPKLILDLNALVSALGYEEIQLDEETQFDEEKQLDEETQFDEEKQLDEAENMSQ